MLLLVSPLSVASIRNTLVKIKGVLFALSQLVHRKGEGVEMFKDLRNIEEVTVTVLIYRARLEWPHDLGAKRFTTDSTSDS